MTTSMKDTLFLTWIEHRRTRQLCARLGIPLRELVTRRKGALRYAQLSLRTVSALLRRRPRTLLVQNPSIVLSFLCLLLRPVFGYKLVVDAHNEAVEPFLHQSAIIRFITRTLLSRADITIVTNRQLAATVEKQGGRPLILPDGIPTPPDHRTTDLPGHFRIVLISTFAGDEPIEIVFEAMRELGDDVHLYVTGNPAKLREPLRAQLPRNVTLTGFLPEDGYWSLLASADAIMDLTTMSNCLVCGAYEAIAVNRPLILSRNDASVELFQGFAVFADNNPSSVVGSVRAVIKDRARMIEEQPQHLARFEAAWDRQAAALTQSIKARH